MLWVAAPGAEPQAEIDALAALLDAGERARLARFHHADDRWSYAAAHGLCRVMLSRAAGLPPRNWRFVATAHGRPMVDPASGPPLTFSLSHTRGMAACGVMTRPRDDITAAIGVDVESLDRAPDSLGLARRFFHPHEAAALAERPPGERDAAFIGLWTLKEAMVKALGSGLQQGLTSFRVDSDPPSLIEAAPVFGPIAAWRLGRWTLAPGHSLALA
ncbi:4'-phosphopantetheinyl transferase family protein, partial [Rhodospirillum rubrum]|uniref:4'-phosphopantetheinyl transferase family protein n=1 Tax=Rhodospirillum rubrum TaxID=1085 RepID=UPI003B8A7EE8